ncbi:MAG: tetratricopeptide repeat protein [Opitutaceae bacterium]
MPFLLDDLESIVGNASIRDIATGAWAKPPATGGETVSGRPLLNLSFALDYAVGGPAVAGYHLVNIGLHIVAALLLVAVVRRSLAAAREKHRRKGGEAETQTEAGWLAFAAACLWSLHPLTTAAVTYVSQRAEVLSALWLLLTIYGYLRWCSGGARSSGWMLFSVAACVAGMATKETMAPAPLIVLLHDRVFIAGSLRAALERRWRYYLALAASWLLLGWLVWTNHGRGGSAGFGTAVEPWRYLMVQCTAIPRYLRLGFVPVGLVFDHGAVTQVGWGDALLGGRLLLGLAGGSCWALWRNRVLGFLGTTFFLLLAPSSSVVPVATQTIAEHRMYLPSAVVLLAVVFALGRANWFRQQRAVRIGAMAGLACVLGVLTWQRNELYRRPAALWTDTVRQRPFNPRAYNNLGLALRDEGRTAEAEAAFLRAIELQPAHAFAHFNLGTLLLAQARYADAAAHFASCLAADPRHVDARINRGQALAALGRRDEAVAECRAALRLAPEAFDAATNLGALLIAEGHLAEAEHWLRRALVLAPATPETHFQLGRLAQRKGDNPAAAASFREALRLRSGFVAAHLALGDCLAQVGEATAALGCYREALRLAPRSVEAHFALGNLLAEQRRFPDAIGAYRAALALDPEHVPARTNLGNCQLVTGDLSGAIGTYQEVLRRRPGEPTATRNLALAREYFGH